jgi:hypothetical protein
MGKVRSERFLEKRSIGVIGFLSLRAGNKKHKAVFSFDMMFSEKMEKSDILIRAWDLGRNVVYLHADDIISVTSQPLQSPLDTQQNVEESQTMSEQPVYTTEDIAEQDQTIRQWAGYDTESATDEQLVETIVGKEITDGQTVQIPNWLKDGIAEWYVSGNITYDEFAAVISYLYERGLLVLEESQPET